MSTGWTGEDKVKLLCFASVVLTAISIAETIG